MSTKSLVVWILDKSHTKALGQGKTPLLFFYKPQSSIGRDSQHQVSSKACSKPHAHYTVSSKIKAVHLHISQTSYHGIPPVSAYTIKAQCIHYKVGHGWTLLIKMAQVITIFISINTLF